jgi:hypothetical protein
MSGSNRTSEAEPGRKWQAVSGCEALRGVPAVSTMVTWCQEVTIQTASARKSSRGAITVGPSKMRLVMQCFGN